MKQRIEAGEPFDLAVLVNSGRRDDSGRPTLLAKRSGHPEGGVALRSARRPNPRHQHRQKHSSRPLLTAKSTSRKCQHDLSGWPVRALGASRCAAGKNDYDDRIGFQHEQRRRCGVGPDRDPDILSRSRAQLLSPLPASSRILSLRRRLRRIHRIRKPHAI